MQRRKIYSVVGRVKSTNALHPKNALYLIVRPFHATSPSAQHGSEEALRGQGNASLRPTLNRAQRIQATASEIQNIYQRSPTSSHNIRSGAPPESTSRIPQKSHDHYSNSYFRVQAWNAHHAARPSKKGPNIRFHGSHPKQSFENSTPERPFKPRRSIESRSVRDDSAQYPTFRSLSLEVNEDQDQETPRRAPPSHRITNSPRTRPSRSNQTRSPRRSSGGGGGGGGGGGDNGDRSTPSRRRRPRNDSNSFGAGPTKAAGPPYRITEGSMTEEEIQYHRQRKLAAELRPIAHALDDVSMETLGGLGPAVATGEQGMQEIVREKVKEAERIVRMRRGSSGGITGEWNRGWESGRQKVVGEELVDLVEPVIGGKGKGRGEEVVKRLVVGEGEGKLPELERGVLGVVERMVGLNGSFLDRDRARLVREVAKVVSVVRGNGK